MDKLLTSVAVGEALGIHPKTVERMCRRGELPGRKIGRKWFFHPNMIDSLFSTGVGSSRVQDVPQESISAR